MSDEPNGDGNRKVAWISLRVEPELAARVIRAAAADQRPVAAWMRIRLLEWLERDGG